VSHICNHVKNHINRITYTSVHNIVDNTHYTLANIMAMRSRMMLPMPPGADNDEEAAAKQRLIPNGPTQKQNEDKYIANVMSELKTKYMQSNEREVLDVLVALESLADATKDNEEEEEGGCDPCSGLWFGVSWIGACIMFFGVGWLYYHFAGTDARDEFSLSMQRFVGLPIAADAPDGTDDIAWWQFKNILCGLMLGLVFGFLDNFGLFFGSATLDGIFYPLGMRFAKNVLPSGTETTNIHAFANDMMAGFGNTFSDMMGVVLGSAALEIAKAGMDVDPTFWVGDILSMMIGCLAGVLAPSIVKNSGQYPAISFTARIASYVVMGGLFVGIIVSGIPGAAFVYIATSCIALAVIAAFLLLWFAMFDMSGPSTVTPMSSGKRFTRPTMRRKN
jgi:hypothetical protein